MPRNYRQEKRRPGCRFCANPQRYVIDYKNVRLLERFVDEDGSMLKASKTKNCRLHQSHIAQQIKRAREMALLPYIAD